MSYTKFLYFFLVFSFVLEIGSFSQVFAAGEGATQAAVAPSGEGRAALTQFLAAQDYAAAYRGLKPQVGTLSDEEIVKFLLTSNKYTQWASLTSADREWVVREVAVSSERAELKKFMAQQDYRAAFRALKTGGNAASDEDLTVFLLTSNKYTKWATLASADREWVVREVAASPVSSVSPPSVSPPSVSPVSSVSPPSVSPPSVSPASSVGLEEDNLKKFMAKQDYSAAFRALRTAGNTASDEDLTVFLLTSNGYTKWGALTPVDREWAVESMATNPDRKALGVHMGKQDYCAAYCALRAAGNAASDEDLVEFLLTNNGYDVERWEALAPTDREWVITKMTATAERKALRDFLSTKDYWGAYVALKKQVGHLPDADIVGFLLTSNGCTTKWATLGVADKEWVVARVTKKPTKSKVFPQSIKNAELREHLQQILATAMKHGRLVQDEISRTIYLFRNFDNADLPLILGLAKSLRSRVEEWDSKVDGQTRSLFQMIDTVDAETCGTFRQSLKSFRRMMTRMIRNKGIPSESELPLKLKVNPWKVNDPYFALVRERGAEDETKPVDWTSYAVAEQRLKNLYARLEVSQKITDRLLIDYESIPQDILSDYEIYSVIYPHLADYLKGNGHDRFIAQRKMDFIESIRILAGMGERYKSYSKLAHRVLRLADLIWDPMGQQRVHDALLVPVLVRIAKASGHCQAHQDEDLSWAVAKLLRSEPPQTETDRLEERMALFMSLNNEQVISDLVNEERWWGREDANYIGGALSHIVPRVKQRLAKTVCLQGDPGSFVDDTSVGEEYSRMPVATLFSKFYKVLSVDRLVDNVTLDINNSFKFLPLKHVPLSSAETRGKTKEEVDALRKEKFSCQSKGILRGQDLTAYVERMSPGRNVYEVFTFDMESMVPTFHKTSTRRLLYGLGYLEEDD